MRHPEPESKKPSANTPITPRPTGRLIFLCLLLIVAAPLVFRLASGSGILPGVPSAPIDQFDYLARRGLTDAFQFVGTLIKEGPDGAYDLTTARFRKKVPIDVFTAYVNKCPAIRRIIRDEARIPFGAVDVDAGVSDQPLPDTIRWQGKLPTDDELQPVVYLEMVVEAGAAKVDLIRVRDDTLPSP